MKFNKKKVVVAVAVAVAIVLPAMAIYSDVGEGYAFAGAAHLVAPIDCWWDVFCFGFCSC